jgi:phospholipid/cholesterol/gamma-HCH transport system permease protein
MARAATRRYFGALFRYVRHGVYLPLNWLGGAVVQYVSQITYILSVVAGAVILFVPTMIWNRAVRDVFMRQMLFTAIDGSRMAISMGFSVGVILIVQTVKSLNEYGQSLEYIAPFLLSITVGELAPLIANLLVIGRSGIAITTEMANMRVLGEVDVLEGQGIDPMTYLIMPRVIATAISVFCLALIVLVAMYVSAYLVGSLTGDIFDGFGDFSRGILRKFGSQNEVVYFLAKTIVTGLFIGAIVTTEGLKARRVATDVPRLASSSGVAALTAFFVVNALLTLVISNRFLIWKVPL